MGVAYIHSILITFHKKSVSRKNTIIDDKSIPIPIQNRIVQIIANGRRSNEGVNGVPVNRMTKNKGIKENIRFIAEDSTLDIGKIYFGIYTFVIKEEFPTIEDNPILVASVKKLKNTIPIMDFCSVKQGS